MFGKPAGEQCCVQRQEGSGKRLLVVCAGKRLVASDGRGDALVLAVRVRGNYVLDDLTETTAMFTPVTGWNRCRSVGTRYVVTSSRLPQSSMAWVSNCS